MIIVFLAARHDHLVKFESLIVILGIVRHSLLGVENAVAIFRAKMAPLHPYMCKVRDVAFFPYNIIGCFSKNHPIQSVHGGIRWYQKWFDQNNGKTPEVLSSLQEYADEILGC